jgi:hypothetical protein
MPDRDPADLLITMNRVVASLEAMADSLECICLHFGAKKPPSKPANKSGKRGGK